MSRAITDDRVTVSERPVPERSRPSPVSTVKSENLSPPASRLAKDSFSRVGNEETRLRNIESMIMTDVDKVRARIDVETAAGRIAGIDTPILVMGRESDELQGIFRLSYELMSEAGKDVEWVSYDHPMHGYIYPVRGGDGEYQVDETQRQAIDTILAYLGRHFAP